MAGNRNWELPLIWASVGTIFGVVAVLAASALTAVLNDPDVLEEGEIVVLSGRDYSLGEQRQVLIDQWNELHPRSQARIVELSERADGARSEMLARAQAGRGDVDVFNLDVTWTAEFAAAGHIRSLDETQVDTASFLAKPLATGRYGGRLWALPFNTDVGLLYYRPDLVPDLPITWDRLERQVVEARERAVADGYAGQLANYEGLTVTALELIVGEGGDDVLDDGVIDLDGQSTAIRAGLDRLQRIVPPGVPELSEDESTQLFRSGRALFMRNWPVAYRTLAQDPEGTQPVDVGVALLPGPSVLGGQNLAVSAHSERPRAAQALIEFLTSERSQQILFERGGLPATRRVVYFDEAVLRLNPHAPTMLTAIDEAVLRPVEPHYARFSEVFRTAVDQYLRGRTPIPADFRDRLSDALQGRLAPIDGG